MRNYDAEMRKRRRADLNARERFAIWVLLSLLLVVTIGFFYLAAIAS